MKKINTWMVWVFWLFKGKIPTTKEAIAMNLTHETNIYGDGIIFTGYSRSIWYDQYGRRFRCAQLLEGGNDRVMNEILRQQPDFLS